MAEIVDLAIGLIPLFSEGIAFRFRSKERRWELVKLPAPYILTFRHSLITLFNCLIPLMLGPDQVANWGEPNLDKPLYDRAFYEHRPSSTVRRLLQDFEGERATNYLKPSRGVRYDYKM